VGRLAWRTRGGTDELRWMILRPYQAELMRAYSVGVSVGSVAVTIPHCSIRLWDALIPDQKTDPPRAGQVRARPAFRMAGGVYRITRSTRMIETRTAHQERTDRPAITAADCPNDKRPSVPARSPPSWTRFAPALFKVLIGAPCPLTRHLNANPIQTQNRSLNILALFTS